MNISMILVALAMQLTAVNYSLWLFFTFLGYCQFFTKYFHVFAYLLFQYTGVDLRGGYLRMTEHLAYGFNRHSVNC